MIVKTDFTRGDGLARHLSRRDTNARVLIREDLSQGVPLDLALAVPFLGSFAATNPRTVRRVIHVKCSPGEEDGAASRVVLDLLLERYGISPAAPRICAQHTKPSADGEPRPDHFHFVFPLVDPETGKAIRSHDAKLKDEIVSRLAEIALGEPIVPGVQHDHVLAVFRKEGQTDIADGLAQYPAARRGERMTTGTRRALQRAGVDPKKPASQLLECWRVAGEDVGAFVAAARERGFELRRGESVVLAVHLASEALIPLRRALNEASKAGGNALHLTKASCDDLFSDLPGHVGKQERRDASKLNTDRTQTDEQLILLGREALADGDGRAAARAFGAVAARRLSWEAERKQDFRTIAAERQNEQRRARTLEQHRVKRAFRHAGIFSDRRLRRLAVVAAAAGAVLAGGGLGAAMLAGGIALAAIPSYERARTLAFIERRERLARYQRKEGELLQHKAATGAVKSDWMKALNARGDHLLAGAYFDLLLIERRRSLRYHEKQLKRALKTALRKVKATMLEDLSRRTDAPAMGKALGFKSMRSDPDRRAVAQALRERSQASAADALDPLHAWVRDHSIYAPMWTSDDESGRSKTAKMASEAERRPETQASALGPSGHVAVPTASGKAIPTFAENPGSGVGRIPSVPAGTGHAGAGAGGAMPMPRPSPARPSRPPTVRGGRGYGD